MIPKRDTILQTAYDQYDGGIYYREPIRKTFMGAASYVTGSHNIKVGIQYGYGYFWRQRRESADLIQLYRSGVPSQVIIHNTPQDSRTDMNADQGIYAQDSWTVGRFTINPGVRFEHFNSSTDERSALPGRFVPFRTFAGARERAELERHLAAPRLRLGRAGQRQDRGEGGLRQVHACLLVGLLGHLRSELLHVGHADLGGPERRRHRAGRLQYAADGTRVPCVYRTAGCEIDFSTLPVTFGVKPAQNFASGHQAPVPVRDERERAAGDRPRHVGDLLLHPPRLQGR